MCARKPAVTESAECAGRGQWGHGNRPHFPLIVWSEGEGSMQAEPHAACNQLSLVFTCSAPVQRLKTIRLNYELQLICQCLLH